MSREYSGEAGIEDTMKEVQSLRKAGIRVIAIINGRSPDTGAALRIYQKDYVRIERPDQLARAAGDLYRSRSCSFTDEDSATKLW